MWALISAGNYPIDWVWVDDETIEARMKAFAKWFKDNNIPVQMRYNIRLEYPDRYLPLT